MTSFLTFFSGGYIERCTAMRREPQALARAWEDPHTGFLPIWEAQCVIRNGAAARLTRDELGSRLVALDRCIFLGLRDNQNLFAFALDEREAPADLGELGGLRDLISRVPESDAGLLAYARAMVNWQRQHQYCGVCGAPNRPEEGGFLLVCTANESGHRSFPRLDPAIIVLVHHDQHCLLGRQESWPGNRFSTIAGFVEPGESLEDAVRREVAEETNIGISRCRYLGSQPWPFPASLMIGFHAEAANEDIRLNDGELAEARWFARAELAGGDIVLPPRASVAYKLIEAWFDEAPGPGLATLHRDGAFLRPPDRVPEER